MTNFDNINTNCEKYGLDAFNRFFSSKNGFFVLNFNIRSFNANIAEFSSYLSSLAYPPDVIILTETWFSPNYSDSIDGYRGFHCYRDTLTRGGGVSIFVRLELKAHIAEVTSRVTNSIELLVLKLFPPNSQPFYIVGIYRPPNANLVDEFVSEMDDVLEVLNVNDSSIISGDFNIDLSSPRSVDLNFIDLMNCNLFMPLIDHPTRIDHGGRESILEHIWSNILHETYSGVFTDQITDHLITFSFVPCIKIENSPVITEFRDHSEECVEGFERNLSSFLDNFALVTDEHLDEKFTRFNQGLLCLYFDSCPLRTKTISTKKLLKPWISTSILNMINRKHYLFRRYKCGDIAFSVYRNFNSKLTKSLKSAKRNYFLRKFEHAQSDSGLTWKLINGLIGSKHNKN